MKWLVGDFGDAVFGLGCLAVLFYHSPASWWWLPVMLLMGTVFNFTIQRLIDRYMVWKHRNDEVPF